MAVYFGSQFVDVTRNIWVEDKSIEKAILEGTISEYRNSEVNRVADYAFYKYLSLTSINLPNVSYIGNSAFYYCYFLTSIDLPNVSYIGKYAFEGCVLTSANLPNVNYIESCAFCYCDFISVNLPNVSYIGKSAFKGCSFFSSISLPNINYIGASAFYSCTVLNNIYILSNSICLLEHSDAFAYTSIEPNGSIYVPASLYNSYIEAENWSYYSSYLVSI